MQSSSTQSWNSRNQLSPVIEVNEELVATQAVGDDKIMLSKDWDALTNSKCC